MAGLFKRRSGRLVRWDEDLLWSPTLSAKDPQIPVLPLQDPYRIRVAWAEIRYQPAPGVTIAGTIGAARALGKTATAVVGISCTAGRARAQGGVAAVNGALSLACTAGAAGAAGKTASIGAGTYGIRLAWAEIRYVLDSTPLTISCTAGRARALGKTAAIVEPYQVRLAWAEIRYRPTPGLVVISGVAARARARGLVATLGVSDLIACQAGKAGASGPRGVIFDVIESYVTGVGAAGAAGLTATIAQPGVIAANAARAAARGATASVLIAAAIISCSTGRSGASGKTATIATTVNGVAGRARALGRVAAVVDGPTGPSVFAFAGRARAGGSKAAINQTISARAARAGARGLTAAFEAGIQLRASASVIAQARLDPALMDAVGHIGAYAYLDAGDGRAHGLLAMRVRQSPTLQIVFREN